MLTVTLSQLKTVAYAMSTEETRYYLNGIYAECTHKGGTLTACDGHRLANIPVQSDCKTEWAEIIPKEIIKQAIGLKSPTYIIHKSYIEAGNIKLAYVGIDGTFPDYRRVVPDTSEGLKIKFNRKYLMDLLKASDSTSITFECVDGNTPAKVYTDEEKLQVHVIMPMRF